MDLPKAAFLTLFSTYNSEYFAHLPTLIEAGGIFATIITNFELFAYLFSRGKPGIAM